MVIHICHVGINKNKIGVFTSNFQWICVYFFLRWTSKQLSASPPWCVPSWRSRSAGKLQLHYINAKETLPVTSSLTWSPSPCLQVPVTSWWSHNFVHWASLHMCNLTPPLFLPAYICLYWPLRPEKDSSSINTTNKMEPTPTTSLNIWHWILKVILTLPGKNGDKIYFAILAIVLILVFHAHFKNFPLNSLNMQHFSVRSWVSSPLTGGLEEWLPALLCNIAQRNSSAGSHPCGVMSSLKWHALCFSELPVVLWFRAASATGMKD